MVGVSARDGRALHNSADWRRRRLRRLIRASGRVGRRRAESALELELELAAAAKRRHGTADDGSESDWRWPPMTHSQRDWRPKVAMQILGPASWFWLWRWAGFGPFGLAPGARQWKFAFRVLLVLSELGSELAALANRARAESAAAVSPLPPSQPQPPPPLQPASQPVGRKLGRPASKQIN